MKALTMHKHRSTYAIVATALLLSALLPLVTLNRASAAVFAARKITMYDSTPSATGVQYDVTITPQATGNVLGVVMEFCDNSPIDGEACTATPGTDVPNGVSAALAGWTLDAASDGNTLIWTIGTNTWTASTPVTLSVTGMVNPSNVGSSGTFYARVYSYALAATAQAYTSASPGSYIDFGGFALSTANKLTVTAKVQEKITFCLYTAVDCASGGSSITIGNNGVLDETQAYNNADTKFDIYTNAQSGVVVRARTFASPGHTLTSGTNTITAIGGTAASSLAGSEQYGFCVATSGGSVTAVAPYAGGTGTCSDDLTTGTFTGTGQFALDTGVTGATYGDDIASSGTASATTTGTLNFIGNVSITTEAGIYTTQMALIATGTF